MHLVLAVVVRNLNVVAESNMIIILKRIPEHTRKKDIVDYIEPILKGKMFQKSGVIERVQIQTSKNYQTKRIDCYGIVYIDSDEAANRVIKKLNRKVFQGKNITISQYHHRSWHNDPRFNPLDPGDELKSKRKFDRRYSNLKNSKVQPIDFSSHESFHRKL
jgi:RNA recognition motif-containing protein